MPDHGAFAGGLDFEDSQGLAPADGDDAFVDQRAGLPVVGAGGQGFDAMEAEGCRGVGIGCGDLDGDAGPGGQAVDGLADVIGGVGEVDLAVGF